MTLPLVPLRFRALVLSCGLASLLIVVPSPDVPAMAQPNAQASLRVAGSPFDPDGDGRRERAHVRLELTEPATVDVRIRDFDDRPVLTLANAVRLVPGIHEWAWNGRDRRGRRVPYGPYRVRATVRPDSGSVLRRLAWVTRARRVPYPVRPGAIVVALDPGHGGPAAGAVWRRLAEDDVNLDIGLRLEAMLKGAGVRVVMTRRADRNVSPKGLDLTGDGRYTRTDELIARNDIANQAGADVHIAIHNNATGCHCVRGTEMYTRRSGGWAPEGRRLARHVLIDHLWHLRRVPGYRPRDRGVAFHPFKALMPYHRRRMPRPSLQASILGESLFLDWPSEHRILARRWGRTLIAAAYFDGIARYLAWRPFGLRYEIVEAPGQAAPGDDASVAVRLTNRGHRTSAGWRLVALVAPSRFRYDGRPRRGTLEASVAVPDGLAPGESVELTLPGITMPTREGRWLIKLDVDLPRGDHLSRHGVVGPQLRVRIVEP